LPEYFDVCEFDQLGANAILAVSLAVCKAGAYVKKIPLYQVLFLLVALEFFDLIVKYF
jgi:enolase